MILQISMMMTSVQALIITRLSLSLIYYQNGRWWTDRSDPDVLALVTQWQNGLHAWSNHFFLSYIFGVHVWKSVTLSLIEIYRIDSLFTRHTHICVCVDAGWCVQYMRDTYKKDPPTIYSSSFHTFATTSAISIHRYFSYLRDPILCCRSCCDGGGIVRSVCVCPIIIGQHQFSRNTILYICRL